MIGFALGTVAFATHALLGNVDWPILAVGIAGALPGGWFVRRPSDRPARGGDAPPGDRRRPPGHLARVPGRGRVRLLAGRPARSRKDTARALPGRWRRRKIGLLRSTGSPVAPSAPEAQPERQGELFSTISGLEVDPLYTAGSVEIDEERDASCPGVFPFTRGVYPSMYRGKLWTMRQFAGFGTAEETNERCYLLEHGQTGLSTAFDMPSLMGYDSDCQRSLGEGRARGSRSTRSRTWRRSSWHPARRGLRLDDDQLHGADRSPSTSASPRRRASRAPGNDSDGHPQGGTSRRRSGSPAQASMRLVRHGRVLHAGDAEVAPDLHLRLPHPRSRLEHSRSLPSAHERVHVRRGGDRARPRRRRLRARVSFSSTRTWTSSRRSPSTGRAKDPGPGSFASVTARRTRARG